MDVTVDRYRSFDELEKNEILGVDYAIHAQRRPSGIAVIAPHGGLIETRTSLIADRIAAEDFNLYVFEGTKSGGNYAALHITSHRFDEPSCLDLLSTCDTVVAVHGCRGSRARVLIGGLDVVLKDRIASALRDQGVDADSAGHATGATHPNNICNRGRTRMGVQLELTRALRGSAGEARVVAAVRGVLLDLQGMA